MPDSAGTLQDYELGDVIFTSVGDRFRIDHADPRALVSASLLDEWRRGDQEGITVNGDLLYLSGINRTVIYRILEPHPYRFAYCIEWPD